MDGKTFAKPSVESGLSLTKNNSEILFRKPEVDRWKDKTLTKQAEERESSRSENIKVTRFELLKQWEENRRVDNMQAGCILSTYADAYLPVKNGKAEDDIYRAFSLQFFDFLGDCLITDNRDFVIYDYPFFEEDYLISEENPFLFFSNEEFVKPGNFYNFETWHIGLLSQSALNKIVSATNGRGWLIDALIDTNGLVFYKPSDFVWYNLKVQEDKRQKKQGKSLLAAAAAAIIDML